MTAGTDIRQAPPRETYRAVFAVPEWRALWLAQVVSIAGDQFAAVALAVLIYDRTRSPLLAAAAFAVTTGAMFLAGLLLAWTADAYPRRAVMLTCDLACAGLVLVMMIPGLGTGALLALLFAVSLAVEPFLAARMAVNAQVLGTDLFPLGQSVTMATYQAAQFAGFAIGGAVTGALGVRAALAVDAASFAASAALVRFGVKARPAPAGDDGRRPQVLAGARVVLSSRTARIALGLMCLAGFFAAPSGAMVPLGARLGGAGTTGLLLSATFIGSAFGPLLYTRLLRPGRRTAWMAVTATAACAVLTAFALSPPLAAMIVILGVSGACTGYIPAAAGVLFGAIPEKHHGKAGGVLGAGMSLSQGVLVLAAGAAAARVSPVLVIALLGLAGTACGIPLAWAWHRIRKGQRHA